MSGEGSKTGKSFKFGVFGISKMTKETKKLMADKLGKIVAEELDTPRA